MVKVTVNKREEKQLRLRISGISQAKWILPALIESGEYLIQSTNRAIRKGVDIDGEPFKPLTEAYVKRPRNPVVKYKRNRKTGTSTKTIIHKGGGRGGSRKPILQRTGGMLMSLISKATKTKVVVEPGTREMRILGNYHQNPGSRSHMPRRAWIGIRDTDIKPIMKIFKRHADQMLKAVG